MNKLYIPENAFEEYAHCLASFTGKIEVTYSMPIEETHLRLDKDGLSVITSKFNPIYIDHLYHKILLRRRQLNRELLIQAIKLKPSDNLFIIDATAGLAKDAALLALYGYQVLMLEQNPILATIIYYALDNKLIPADNLQLIFTDSIEYFKFNNDIKPDIVYLDPMFNHLPKSLAKKDMQIIQLLVHNNSNSSDIELFNIVQEQAKRVIIKRDYKQATLVNIPAPSYTKVGKTIRYDIYIKPNL